MAKDAPPLLCRSKFGALRPANHAAREAFNAIGEDETIRVRITRTRGNTRRNNLYWACVAVCVENLSDRVSGGILTTDTLHRKLKRDLGLARPVVSKKTGEVIDYDYDSIAFDKMPENERATFIDGAMQLMSKWLGIDVETLLSEGRAQSE